MYSLRAQERSAKSTSRGGARLQRPAVQGVFRGVAADLWKRGGNPGPFAEKEVQREHRVGNVDLAVIVRIGRIGARGRGGSTAQYSAQRTFSTRA